MTDIEPIPDHDSPERPVTTAAVALLDACSGPVVSRSRVVDGLLDLRLVATDAATRDRIDRALRELPGQNLVAREWVADVCADLVALADAPLPVAG